MRRGLSETRRDSGFEIGYNQGVPVRLMLQDAGYTEIRVVKDLAGLDRVVLGRKKQEEHHV